MTQTASSRTNRARMNGKQRVLRSPRPSRPARYDEAPRGISSSVERQLPKLERRVRFPYPALSLGELQDRVRHASRLVASAQLEGLPQLRAHTARHVLELGERGAHPDLG